MLQELCRTANFSILLLFLLLLLNFHFARLTAWVHLLKNGGNKAHHRFLYVWSHIIYHIVCCIRIVLERNCTYFGAGAGVINLFVVQVKIASICYKPPNPTRQPLTKLLQKTSPHAEKYNKNRISLEAKISRTRKREHKAHNHVATVIREQLQSYKMHNLRQIKQSLFLPATWLGTWDSYS